MTKTELNTLTTRLGGFSVLQHCVQQIANIPNHEFTEPLKHILTNDQQFLEHFKPLTSKNTNNPPFPNIPGDEPPGYYLYINDEDEFTPADISKNLTLVYGFYAGGNAGEGEHFNFKKNKNNQYTLNPNAPHSSHIH